MGSQGGEQAVQPTLAQRWREISGEKNWDGLLHPTLDDTLRSEIIRYGEFAQATYDGFDTDSFSKYCGSCRYNKNKLLESVGLYNRGYDVTRYIYATENMELPRFLKHSDKPDDEVWSKDSNWIGYVAVCTDEKELQRIGRRDIVVAWRGTITGLEWVADLKDILTPVTTYKASGTIHATADIKVEAGFLSVYTSAKSESRYNQTSAGEQAKKEVLRLVDLYKNDTLSITITGHSLGAALAVLHAYDIAEEMAYHKGIAATAALAPAAAAAAQTTTTSGNVVIPITVFSFAGPRVGNDAFKKRFDTLGIKTLRMVNVHDVVPRVPGYFTNETVPLIFSEALEYLPWTYSHVGLELKLNSKDSHHLDQTKASTSNWHNLEQYLHLVDGYGRYTQPPCRDLALINKSSDFLKDQRYVPTVWWQVQNKGLVKDNNGLYVQIPREPEDIPIPPRPSNHLDSKPST
jgi:hypothetical protein